MLWLEYGEGGESSEDFPVEEMLRLLHGNYVGMTTPMSAFTYPYNSRKVY